MSKKVFIVCGDTGEYSDYRQWMVEAYMSEDAARARVLELEQLLLAQGFTKRAGEKYMDRPDDWDWCDGEEKIGDSIGVHFSCDSTGMRWYYDAVPIRDAA